MTDSFHKQHTEPHLTEAHEPLPDFIGPYKVESLLSKGGMSWLYLGIDPDTKKTLAIKTLPAAYIKDQLATERFQKEAKIIAITDHPNIVKLYGEGSWKKGLYMAMEWIQGISLRQFLTQHSFSLKRSLEIILQVCYALEHLHSHGVIHRDLKPENILIEESGEIKVIDFGIAQVIKDPTSQLPKSVLGTPYYMSPEQKEDPTKVTYASDIYSLGVIAYELIIGKPTFGTIELSFLPKKLRVIINKALAVSPSERYQTITSFIQDLSAYLASDDFDKEKPHQDYAKELLEIFQKTSLILSPCAPPNWEFTEIGIATDPSEIHFGLYYDLFKVSPDHFFFLIANPIKQGLDPLFTAATLRGMIRSFMTYFIKLNGKDFKPLSLINFLNDQIKDPFIKDFTLSYLYLDATLDKMTFFGAGLSSIIHIPSGASARTLHNHHPLLSHDAISDFSETIDNWNSGDLLIYHSLIPDTGLLEGRKGQMEKELTLIAQESEFLSPQAQSESILKSCKHHSLFSSSKDSHVVMSIQRIS
jgi:eukaryotic-like serine/threonine-protein kinase